MDILSSAAASSPLMTPSMLFRNASSGSLSSSALDAFSAPLARTPDGKLAGTVFVEVADGDGVVLHAERDTVSRFIVDSGLKAEFAP